MFIIIQQTNLLQIFCKFASISEVIFKSIKGSDDTSQEDLQAWMV